MNLVPRSLLLVLILPVLAPCALLAAPGDTDNDGLRDEVETNSGIFVSAENTGTNPNVSDSDGDSMPDGMELRVGTNPTDPASKVQRPNIILINCDDLGYGDIGCFWQNQRSGTRKFATPNLDTMAAEGAKLTNHYAAAPICCSSRSSLLQGRHQGHADIRDTWFDGPIPDNHSIAKNLKSSGYSTFHVGKAGLSGWPWRPSPPLTRGWDHFFGHLTHPDAHEHYPRNGTAYAQSVITYDTQRITDAHSDLYSSDAFTAYAKKTIIEETTQRPHKPFLLYIAYDTPHFIEQFPPTANYPKAITPSNPTGLGVSGGIQWTGSPSYVNTAINDPNRIDNIANRHPSVDPTWAVNYQKYVSMIRRLDDYVADLIQTLKDLSIDDNTLIIFTSDNGPEASGVDPTFFQSYAGFEGMKRDMWEGGLRVPTIVRWPGKIPATNQTSNIREIPQPSANYDWLATFLELAKAPIPAYTDGSSLVPLLTGQGPRGGKDYLYFEFNINGVTIPYPDFPTHGNDTRGQMQAIRIGDFMGVRTSMTATADNPFRIYNVVTDPKQAINLAGARTDIQQRMQYIGLAARRPHEYGTRPYDNTLIPPVLPPGGIRNGITWKSYEGNWPWLPEFRELTPVATGETLNISPSLRSRDKDAGLSFQGYIKIPTTGAYTFETTSNSSTSLWIHDCNVIDNDLNFVATKNSDTFRSGGAYSYVYLTAGYHPYRLYYRHQTGTASLQLKYSGPGITMQPVPATAFFVDGQPTVLQPDTARTTRQTPVLVDVLVNDTAEISPLTIQSLGTPQRGTAAITAEKAQYTPTAGYLGFDQFPYTVNDGIRLVSSSVSATVFFDNEIWLPLDEGTGTSVNAYGTPLPVTGSLIEAADPVQSWANGKLGKALRFDGTDDQVVFPALPLPAAASPRTFSCWIKTSNTSLAENQTIFTYGPASGGQRFTVRLAAGASAGSLVAAVEALPGTLKGTKPLNDGRWHHLALVNDVTEVSQTKIYVDGQPDAVSSSISGLLNTTLGTSACLGGSDQSADCNFNGYVDDVRIFPRALSGSEVEALRSDTMASAAMNGTPPEDFDGDGSSEEAEATAGTDPDDRLSFFKIHSSNITGSGITLQWAGVAGRTYRVEESTGLNNWTLVPGVAPVVVTVNTPNASVNIPANGIPKRFVRLQVMLTL